MIKFETDTWNNAKKSKITLTNEDANSTVRQVCIVHNQCKSAHDGFICKYSSTYGQTKQLICCRKDVCKHLQKSDIKVCQLPTSLLIMSLTFSSILI